MSSYVLGFHDLDRTSFALAGGKGANLGELSRIAGFKCGGRIRRDSARVDLRPAQLTFIKRGRNEITGLVQNQDSHCS